MESSNIRFSGQPHRDWRQIPVMTLRPTPRLRAVLDGHVDPRPIIDVGVMNGNIPAPLVAFDEDDELFLTLTNVGMIMRPDLFEQHTIHFHGYPNASSFYDGVPDASVAINIGAQLYLLLPGAGRRNVLLALPHHAARTLADGHGGPASCAPAPGPGAIGHKSLCLAGPPERPDLQCHGHREHLHTFNSATPDLRTACNPGRRYPVLGHDAGRQHGRDGRHGYVRQPAKVHLQRRRRLDRL